MKKYLLILTMLLAAVSAAAQQRQNIWAIDMTVLSTRDCHYAIWSGWDGYYEECECPVQNLYIAKMELLDSAPYVRLGERHLLSEPELEWELKVKEHISLQEGPEVLYHDDDIFVIYSTRGSWTKDYKLGMLKLRKGADPLERSSWDKGPSPVFTGPYGVGHASFTLSPDGKEYWINYHSKTADKGGWADRKVFFQKFGFDAEGSPVFGEAADPSKPLRRPSGETAVEKIAGKKHPSKTFKNPVRPGADPWIVKEGDKYYSCWSGRNGIEVAESSLMTSNNGRIISVWRPHLGSSEAWNATGAWAPELHHIGERWYIFYASGHQNEAPYWEHRTGVLVSETGPLGPYFEHEDKPLFTGE